MTIAVTTPTGNVGRHVVAMLIRAGVRPRVLARRPERLKPDIRAEVEVVAVDQHDVDAVVAATAGVTALFWVDPPPAGDDPLAEYARATDSVIRAVRENGIGRVVFQSSVGAEKRHGVGEIDGLARTEEALDATAASVTHLRCGMFFSNLELQVDAIRSGTIPVLLPVDHAIPWVAPRDIAEVATTRLLADAWTGRCVRAVHGPADLTWTQVAETVTSVTGHRLRAERISDDSMRELLTTAGMSEARIEALIGMSSGMRDDFTPEQARTVHTSTPTTLASWVGDVLAPLLDGHGPGDRRRP
ncbi:NAD(P)H-binding protein [Micromonospora sediminicola]|uniref:NAD(P)H-binding protein n=1 Tax=Micromonospora sediminicola TaxID=946078 RepID=UPI0037A57410